eukprot:12919801-Prorocentrum_lima.AAC.1
MVTLRCHHQQLLWRATSLATLREVHKPRTRRSQRGGGTVTPHLLASVPAEWIGAHARHPLRNI